MKKQVILPLAIFSFLMIATIVIVLYGSGYRFGLDKGKLGFAGTGLFVATSMPDGAQVFVNDHLTTATNNTINLAPGDYKIKIIKEGYFPWEKNIKIQKEVVSKAEAALFPVAPKLENITATGVENPTLDPSGTKIAYIVSSQTLRKNGIYVLDMSSRPILTLQSASTQIADDTLDKFSKATLAWSPDGKQLTATIEHNGNPATYLLDAGSFNQNPKDVTETLMAVDSQWEKDKAEKEQSRIIALKPMLKKMITERFKVISWSPDETKILYEASESANLPIVINPRLIGVDSTPEERTITKGKIYVYDIKEDKNFKIETGNTNLESENYKGLTWYADSKHLVFVHDKKIDVIEYDGTNSTTVYAGPFIDTFVFPWPDVSKLVILTNLGNTQLSPNLYIINLK